MLSLFDDEDFLPQEKPKPVKPKKSLAIEESVKPEAGKENEDPELPETIAASEVAVTIETPIAAIESTPATGLPEESEAQETALVDEAISTPEEEITIPGNPEEETFTELTDTPANVADNTTPIITTAIPSAGTAEETPATSVSQPEEDELNKQILSEIMLSDYSAFIHKEYPFDLKTVEVVKKDKEIKVTEPVKTIVARAETVDIEEEETDEEPAAPLPEWNLDKRYYTIGEVSQLFKVNTSHIRFWTNEFKLRPRTTRKGDRLYSPEDIAQLRLIHHLVKEKKHTIKGAKEKLKAEKGAVGNKLDLKDSLVSLKEMLVQIKEQL